MAIAATHLRCLNHCTYCKTKHARGDLGSYLPAEIVDRARQAFQGEGAPHSVCAAVIHPHDSIPLMGLCKTWTLDWTDRNSYTCGPTANITVATTGCCQLSLRLLPSFWGKVSSISEMSNVTCILILTRTEVCGLHEKKWIQPVSEPQGFSQSHLFWSLLKYNMHVQFWSDLSSPESRKPHPHMSHPHIPH